MNFKQVSVGSNYLVVIDVTNQHWIANGNKHFYNHNETRSFYYVLCICYIISWKMISEKFSTESLCTIEIQIYAIVGSSSINSSGIPPFIESKTFFGSNWTVEGVPETFITANLDIRWATDSFSTNIPSFSPVKKIMLISKWFFSG